MNRYLKQIALIMSAAVICTASPYTAYAQNEGAPHPGYKKGDRVGDFTVESVSDIDVFDARVYVFRHERTGATVEFIHNDDPNKYFMLEFETPASDDCGCAHVFEHAAMNGSVKYPSRSLTMALFDRAYITYGNAFTQDKCTIYPIASLSEKELLKLSDYYTDLCFEPLILQDEDIFRSEAWRYSLDDVDDDIKVGGTIYSEMSGAYTADIAAVRSAVKMLYPHNASAYEAGGIPSEILKLTYEDVCAFHEKYYHPSNCTAYLYGDIKDAKAFLTLLDGYFDGYEKKDIDKQSVSNNRSAGFFIEKKTDFPVQEGVAVNNRTEIVWAADIGDPSDEELAMLYAFANCCNLDSSSVMLRLRSLYPLATFRFGIESDADGAVMYVCAHGMNENDTKLFMESLVKIFSDMAASGLATGELENFRKVKETDAFLAREGANTAISLLKNISNMNSCGRGPLFYMNMRDSYRNMDGFTNDYVKSVAAGYLASPKRSAMAVVVPKPGLSEENARKLSSKLKSMKDSMTSAEKKKLVEDTKRIVERSSDDPSEYLAQLNVVKTAELPDTIITPRVSDDTDRAGTRRIGVSTKRDGVAMTRLYLDATGLPQDMLHYLALYTDLVNGHFVSTSMISRNELPGMISSYTLRGEEISLKVSSFDDDYIPYVTVDFLCDPKSAQDAFGLTYERLFNSDFSDSSQVMEGISAIKNTVRRNIENSPEQIAAYISYAADSEGAAYYEQTHYLEYYDFLEGLEKKSKNDLARITEKLDQVAWYMNNSEGAVLGYAVSDAERGEYLRYADEFMNNLENRKHETAKYRFAPYPFPLAIVTNDATVSNSIATGDAVSFGATGNVTDTLSYMIVTDSVIKPSLRNSFGTYGCSYRNDTPAMSIYTVDDPAAAASLKVLASVSDAWAYVRENITQEVLDEYIAKMHSKLSLSDGELGDASAVISDMVAKKSADHRAKTAMQLKKIKPADLEKYDAFFEKLGNEGRLVTAGSSEIINGNGDIFVQILDPFSNK